MLSQVDTSLQYVPSYKVQKPETKEKVVAQTIVYILNNYQLKDINLATVAEKNSLSSTYLSYIFKSVTGESFSSYLNKTRLQQSLKLLNLGYKVEEVSELCGYSSDKTYRRSFKSYLGFTPCNFKEQQRKPSHNINYIVKFVNDNFTDENIGLKLISDKFSLSEAYISKLFKIEAGENLSQYIQRLRLSKACTLLTTTGLSIEEISSQCGFSNPHSFRRSFKRVLGLVPTVYREFFS